MLFWIVLRPISPATHSLIISLLPLADTVFFSNSRHLIFWNRLIEFLIKIRVLILLKIFVLLSLFVRLVLCILIEDLKSTILFLIRRNQISLLWNSSLFQWSLLNIVVRIYPKFQYFLLIGLNYLILN